MSIDNKASDGIVEGGIVGGLAALGGYALLGPVYGPYAALKLGLIAAGAGALGAAGYKGIFRR